MLEEFYCWDCSHSLIPANAAGSACGSVPALGEIPWLLHWWGSGGPGLASQSCRPSIQHLGWIRPHFWLGWTRPVIRPRASALITFYPDPTSQGKLGTTIQWKYAFCIGCTVYIVQCTVYSVQCNSVQCTVYSVGFLAFREPENIQLTGRVCIILFSNGAVGHLLAEQPAAEG